jgi:NADPH:quinone reductase-like Zn-dependent oxidoreductase
MRAIVWTKYGPPEALELREVEKPAPKDDEVLIKIHATTVTAGDCEMRSLKLPIIIALPLRIWIGMLKPKENTIPGTELAGEIEAVGKEVKRFKEGDQVFGAAGMGFGANAEYICLPERPGDMEGGFSIKPANMTFEEAATVPFGARDALHFLRLGELRPGQKILINGAGGSIGTFAVQLAKLDGAKVTAVDSAPKLDMLRALGADHVVDYTREDFTKSGEIFDVIFDVVGTVRFSHGNRVLKADGTYLLANPASQILPGLWTQMTSKKKVIMQAASGSIGDLDYLKKLIEEGKIRTVIDRAFPLEEIAEAHRYVESGGKKGNVVMTVVPGDSTA